MRNLLKPLTVAGLLAITAGTASAQSLNLRIGIGDDRGGRIERRSDDRYDRRWDRDRYVERRIYRPAPRRVVCRTEIRRVYRGNGVVVTRPRQVCRTVYSRSMYYR